MLTGQKGRDAAAMRAGQHWPSCRGLLLCSRSSFCTLSASIPMSPASAPCPSQARAEGMSEGGGEGGGEQKLPDLLAADALGPLLAHFLHLPETLEIGT